MAGAAIGDGNITNDSTLSQAAAVTGNPNRQTM